MHGQVSEVFMRKCILVKTKIVKEYNFQQVRQGLGSEVLMHYSAFKSTLQTQRIYFPYRSRCQIGEF